MEKAILKTLIYADIFDYPLLPYEVHKWLIGKTATFRQVEKALEKLRVKGKVIRVKDYYCLPGRSSLVAKRKRREKQSARFLWKAKFMVWFLQVVPWVKLIGVSGGLAMENAGSQDDIDLFVVTGKNRLWLSRLILIGILDFLGVRRQVKMTDQKAGGKLCINILLEEDRLAQYKKDIYLAHEVLQMKVLWQREGIYAKYLSDNDWAFKFIPNWIALAHLQGEAKQSPNAHLGGVATVLENLAKWFQLKIMQKPQGMERIEDGALYFHPNDIRSQILSEYKQRLKKLSNS